MDAQNESMWTRYDIQPPPCAGTYLWRLPSRGVQGLIVQFAANMRERNAGYRVALSPSFDYWDGYKLIVPKDTEWAPTDLVLEHYSSTTEPQFPELSIDPCPFCQKTPTWKGIHRSNGGGIFIGSNPHEFNTFWLECCAWTKTPHVNDPRALAESRNKILQSRPSEPQDGRL